MLSPLPPLSHSLCLTGTFIKIPLHKTQNACLMKLRTHVPQLQCSFSNLSAHQSHVNRIIKSLHIKCLFIQKTEKTLFASLFYNEATR